MFVEYLFNINPLTLLVIMASMIFVVYMRNKPSKKEKLNAIPIVVDYKKINNEAKPDLKVFSYNIMAYNFSKPEWYPYVDVNLLHPKYRAPRILKEISDELPDILALQEVDNDLYLEFYKENLEALGYTIEKTKDQTKIVSILIAVRKSVLNVDSVEYIDLNKELEKIDDSFQKHKEAIITVLSLKSDKSKKVVVINTHLFWNPEYEYIKYGQLSVIIKTLEDKYSRLPIIICGDLHSLPSSNVLKYVYRLPPIINSNSKGDYNLNKKFMEIFAKENAHTLPLRSAYESYMGITEINEEVTESNYRKIADRHPEYTFATKEFLECNDYILYTSSNLNLVSLLKIPNDQEIRENFLPNAKYPSDHLKIGAEFSFK